MKYIVAVISALLSLHLLAFSLPKPLVETQWLADNLNKVVILDVRKKVSKRTKRIPSAILVPWAEVRAKGAEDGVSLVKMLPTKSAFEKLIQSFGINNDSAVVITSKATAADEVFLGTRLYWQLKYFGHDNVAILNGGNAKWFKEKRPTAKKSLKFSKGNFVAVGQRDEILATTKHVANVLGDNKTTMIDTRTEDMYLGLSKRGYVSAFGHIPSAKSADGNIFLSQGEIKTFRQADIIKNILIAKGIDPNANNISYCNSGHLASGVWFIESELLGNKNSKLYDGSMHAWTKGGKRPVVNKASR